MTTMTERGSIGVNLRNHGANGRKIAHAYVSVNYGFARGRGWAILIAWVAWSTRQYAPCCQDRYPSRTFRPGPKRVRPFFMFQHGRGFAGFSGAGTNGFDFPRSAHDNPIITTNTGGRVLCKFLNWRARLRWLDWLRAAPIRQARIFSAGWLVLRPGRLYPTLPAVMPPRVRLSAAWAGWSATTSACADNPLTPRFRAAAPGPDNNAIRGTNPGGVFACATGRISPARRGG